MSRDLSSPLPPSRAPTRLRTKIALVLTVGAIGAFTAVAGAGWLLVLEAEDAIMESLVLDAVRSHEGGDQAPALPPWLIRLEDGAALLEGTGLKEAPDGLGPHEMFTSDQGRDAIVIQGTADRWRLWLGAGREREFRLLRDGSSGGWWVADLSYFEFTEARSTAVRRSVLAAAVAVGLLTLLLSTLITRWTLRPVVTLAARVQAATEPAPRSEPPLAAGMPDDEVGFLARTLDESRRRVAESLNRERQFISECSHELRTPIAVLKAATALLPEVETEPEGRARVLARMARAVHRSERLVQFFLVLAREGRERADAGWVPLRAIVEEAIDDHRTIRADHAARPIEIAVPETAQVHASRDVLLMLVHNLIGNSLQHATEGRVSVAWVEDSVLAIEDEGLGFPGPGEETRPRGYGLGLSLARRLCETQGWGLQTGRTTQGGAKVTIHFPGSAIRRVDKDAGAATTV